MADNATTTVTPGNMDFLGPMWQQWLTHMQSITPESMPVYGGPTVAPFSQNQQTAFDMSRQLAMNGTPAYNASTNAIGQQAAGVQNPYMGSNPYTQQVLQGLNNDMADAYARGTAAQTRDAFARDGAFGGSAYNETQGANNQAFANALGVTDSGLLNQNFYNSANMFQQGQQNQLQAAGLGLASQGTDLNAIGNLYNMGANQQGNNQALLGAAQNYFNQSVQAPFASASLMGNALSQASGAPTSQTTTYQPPGSSPLAYASLIPIFASLYNGGLLS